MIEGHTVVHENTYPHPPERVWQALVDPDEISSWLMPSKDFAPRVGQRFTMECDPFGPLRGEVLEADPPRRLAYRWEGSFGTTTVTFTLTPSEAGTHLRMEHRGWDAPHAGDQRQFDGGWTAKLTIRLRTLLDTPAYRP